MESVAEFALYICNLNLAPCNLKVARVAAHDPRVRVHAKTVTTQSLAA